jgi:hypothetical protein
MHQDQAFDRLSASRFSGIPRTQLYALMRRGDLNYSKPDGVRKRVIFRSELVRLMARYLVVNERMTTHERQEIVREGCRTIQGTVEWSPFGRTKLFELMKSGTIPSVRLPNVDPLIPRLAAWDFLRAGLVRPETAAGELALSA